MAAMAHGNIKTTARLELRDPWAATRRRKRRELVAAKTIVALVVLFSVLLAAWPAHAVDREFQARFHTTKPGDIIAIGNVVLNCAPYNDTSNADCNATRVHGFPTGGQNNNDFPARYIKVDPSGPGSNNSRATLSIPTGATVEFAGLYWSGALANGVGTRVSVRTPGQTTYNLVNADQSDSSTAANLVVYQSFADVTDIVSTAGSGDYYVGDIETLSFGINTWAGWSLVVVYTMPGLPLRDLAVFDGWKYATTSGAATDVPVSGFTTPLSGPVASRLTVLVWDGDRADTETGSSLEFGPDTANLSPVSNAMNPANNFWNSTISIDGALVTSGMMPNYLNTLGMDLDVVVPAVPLPNGATSAVARLRGGGDESIYIGMVGLVNDAYLPSLEDRLKTSEVEDASGNLLPGGVLTYTINAINNGTDDASSVVVTDEIPEGTTYVPGSLEILSGGGATGDMSDGANDDQADYDSANRRVEFRVGAGAGTGAGQGGTLAQGATLQVRFQVRVDDDTDVGDIVSNQALFDYFAEQLQTTIQDESDADLSTPENEPTIDEVVGRDADLAVTKTASANSVGNGGTVEYTIVVSNNGPEAGDNAVVHDPAVTGIDCAAATLSCAADGGAACPAAPTVVQLQAAPGLVIPTLPGGGQVTLRMACTLSVP
ncbi:hypothetical protein [Lysobacter sp. F6437]|uniref:hypothetical protein n=1 Tax=Lysobacter sp. F6437 TaxID=3459296 RepID=UPI00403DE1D6